MVKMKLLLITLMCVLIIFAAQRVHIEKTYALEEIYSDIFFTKLAVGSQQYTRQIEYGVKNGKSLDNFYDIQSVMSGVRRCSSYINGTFIISDDLTVLYSAVDDEKYEITRIGIDSAYGEKIYSVYNEPQKTRYLLTMPIYGRSETVCGYMVLSISHDAVNNTLSDFYRESSILEYTLGALMFLIGSILMIHLCRRRERLFRRGLGIISVTVCLFLAANTLICAYKLDVIIESIVGHSVSEITMSLQNDLDTLQEKGAVLGKIYDINDWLYESSNKIPFITMWILDKNYKIAAMISDEYIEQQIWHYADALLKLLFWFAAAGFAVYLIVGAVERTVHKRSLKNAVKKNNARGDAEYAESSAQK